MFSFEPCPKNDDVVEAMDLGEHAGHLGRASSDRLR
jgi:hypothetical protein